MKKALLNSFIIAVTVVAFIGCERDFTDIGIDVIGDNNFETNSFKYPVVTYNRLTDSVRTNNLPLNFLGIYEDPNYGTTTANYLSQLALSSNNPSFGDNPVLDSVVLTIPYFSQAQELTSEGETIYTIDSIFSSDSTRLSVFRSNYFLRDFNPDEGFEDAQNYYSNGATSKTSAINLTELEGDLLAVDTIVPSASEIQLYTFNEETEVNEITQRLAPALRIVFEDSLYWQENILNKQGDQELSNFANFRDYFRGLYLKAEPLTGNSGSMMLLDFTSTLSNITLYYKRDVIEEGETEPGREQTSFSINFAGNRFNLFNNQFNVTLADGDATTGDEKLYLKGGDGSMAIIDLFNGMVEDDDGNQITAWQHFEDNFGTSDDPKRLINEANLVFYVDENINRGEEPNRIYLYDLDNQIQLIDFDFDPTANNGDPEISRVQHLQPLEREGGANDGDGIRYKIRITEHLNNILLRDSTNVKLGLVVSGNINLEGGPNQFELLSDEDDILNKIPVSSILSPRGTILYGNNTTQEDKKVQLEIFYTDPNN